jgi:hypothetical protein
MLAIEPELRVTVAQMTDHLPQPTNVLRANFMCKMFAKGCFGCWLPNWTCSMNPSQSPGDLIFKKLPQQAGRASPVGLYA